MMSGKQKIGMGECQMASPIFCRNTRPDHKISDNSLELNIR